MRLRIVCLVVLAAAALLPAGLAQAETRCESRPATGGGTLTSCREVGGAGPAQQWDLPRA